MFRTAPQRLALASLLLVLICVSATFPAFPVDETRYLTVAWEMRQGHWILPVLNGLPYSHKPPLLFWLINAVWSVADFGIWPVRALCCLCAVIVLILTRRLAQALYPEQPRIYELAPLLTLASPLFLVFSNMIMFDQLLYVFVLLALCGLWRAGQAKGLAPWLLFGVAVGLGILAKGPVMLVNVLPPALLAPWLWLRPESGYGRAAWFGHLLLGLLVAAAVALAWAVPAALIGGPDYAHMIFWGQSAGRMVGSFAHAEAFWFYLPCALEYIAPWLFLLPLWRARRHLTGWTATPQVRFLLGWLVPAFVILSLISGKQLHYILPLLGGAAILAAAALGRAVPAERDRRPLPWFVLPYVVGLIGMAALPLLPFVRHNHKYQNLSQGVAYFESWPFLLAALACVLIAWTLRRRVEDQVLAMVVCGCLAFCVTTIEGGLHLFRYYDLTPLRAALAPYRTGEVAVNAPYEGEINFLARLARPATVIKSADATSWLAGHPDGVLVLRNRTTDPLPPGRQVYTQLYHGDQRYTVLLPP